MPARRHRRGLAAPVFRHSRSGANASPTCNVASTCVTPTAASCTSRVTVARSAAQRSTSSRVYRLRARRADRLVVPLRPRPAMAAMPQVPGRGWPTAPGSRRLPARGARSQVAVATKRMPSRPPQARRGRPAARAATAAGREGVARTEWRAAASLSGCMAKPARLAASWPVSSRRQQANKGPVTRKRCQTCIWACQRATKPPAPITCPASPLRHLLATGWQASRHGGHAVQHAQAPAQPKAPTPIGVRVQHGLLPSNRPAPQRAAAPARAHRAAPGCCRTDRPLPPQTWPTARNNSSRVDWPCVMRAMACASSGRTVPSPSSASNATRLSSLTSAWLPQPRMPSPYRSTAVVNYYPSQYSHIPRTVPGFEATQLTLSG